MSGSSIQTSRPGPGVGPAITPAVPRRPAWTGRCAPSRTPSGSRDQHRARRRRNAQAEHDPARAPLRRTAAGDEATRRERQLAGVGRGTLPDSERTARNYMEVPIGSGRRFARRHHNAPRVASARVTLSTQRTKDGTDKRDDRQRHVPVQGDSHTFPPPRLRSPRHPSLPARGIASWPLRAPLVIRASSMTLGRSSYSPLCAAVQHPTGRDKHRRSAPARRRRGPASQWVEPPLLRAKAEPDRPMADLLVAHAPQTNLASMSNPSLLGPQS